MRFGIFILLASLFAMVPTVRASDRTSSEVKCSPGAIQMPTSSGVCSPANDTVFPPLSVGGAPPLPSAQDTDHSKNVLQHKAAGRARKAAVPKARTIIYFFHGKGCPHCEEEKLFLDALGRKDPSLEIKAYEVWYNRKNAGLMENMLRARGLRSSGVPVTFLHDQVFTGFNDRVRASLENEIARCSKVPCEDPRKVVGKAVPEPRPQQDRQLAVATPATTNKPAHEPAATIPVLGGLDVRKMGLPVLTLLLAGVDSFNPCAFFVLLSLLGVLVHAQSRNKMLLIGWIFVFFSGFIYFLFMAAWLNLFLLMGHVAVITVIAGLIAIVMAGINIKDFFLFRQGVSLSIPDSAKPGMFDRMRKLLRSTSFASIIVGTTALAVAANFYELLCTAGFPMVFTRILTLHNLSISAYYLYLVFYNIVYVIPLLLIVLGFVFTLGRRKLSEWQGRLLKLMSGVMMLGLGTVLLVNPALLNSVAVSFMIVALALVVTLLTALLAKRMCGMGK